MSDAPTFVRVIPPGRFVWGMQLPVVAQSTVFAAPWEAAAGPAEVARVAAACDAAGFFYVSVCDHIVVPRAQATAMSTVWFDTVATLGWLAAVTRHVRLLSYVYVPGYRHPLQTAKAFATLDALSAGRVILGVGAGHVEGEFQTLGVPFTGRGKRLDESIVAIRAALLDEWPEHDGPHWRFADVGLRPRPVQTPRPPIWVGGNTEAALRRTARLADGWLPQGTFRDQLPAQLAFIHAERARVHGDGHPIEIGGTSPWLYVGTPSFDVGPNACTGAPAAIAENLRALAALGVHHVSVRFRSRTCDELLDQIAAFAADVAPLLVGAGS